MVGVALRSLSPRLIGPDMFASPFLPAGILTSVFVSAPILSLDSVSQPPLSRCSLFTVEPTLLIGQQVLQGHECNGYMTSLECFSIQ